MTPQPAEHNADPAFPSSPACERNREPILAVLREVLARRHSVLEIGSGTGQHAVHFAGAMPWLRSQCSDRPEALGGLLPRLHAAALANTPPPLALDVAVGPWPTGGGARFDAAFTANTLHIMDWPAVEACFDGLDRTLADDATFVVYGPFKFAGTCTNDSNRAFDAMLRARDPRSGIRDFEAVDALAADIGLRLQDDIAMPAHNRCLIWRRGRAEAGADTPASGHPGPADASRGGSPGNAARNSRSHP
ncbi:DUF938 domain-containing protein [Luteimonas sp. SJ-16]|uniref:DUF938 domain-containing protein n=1 Tax=Luteimonas deserti TaxID=2752306 RepID=A0A7Z0QPD2_9GAMM|nr:DUF938 domain-containing protein [Luteimonas deserti]